MKKIFAIPLLFLYMIAVSGVMIQLHYCGQKLDSWNVYLNDIKGCDDDNCDDESGCCKDEVITAKVSDDQQATPQFKFDFITTVATVPQQHYLPYAVAFTNSNSEGISYHANAPPGLWQYTPLYKLHTSFTFYG